MASLSSRFRRATAARRANRKLQLEPLEARAVPAIFAVTTTADSGAGSLRAAITNANQSAGVDTISFNLPGSGVQTIALQSALPSIQANQPVLIDGWSQPSATGAPLIQISSGASNIEYGLSVFASDSTFRGLILNGFTGASFGLWGSDRNRIQGCFLGTNAAGTSKQGSTSIGIHLAAGSEQNIIGTDGDGANDAREANIIAGHSQMGVWLFGAGTDHNRIAGNYVGTNATLSPGLGNGRGVYISGGAKQNLVGSNWDGVSDGLERNVIHNNQDSGVVIVDATSHRNQIQGNLIFGNVGAEIDLGNDSVTHNAPWDGTAGPNAWQNYPVLRSLSVSAGSFIVTGALNSRANFGYRIEFFASRAMDDSGHGSGQQYLGAINVTTDADGIANFTRSFEFPLAFGWTISATATDALGNTSEFSPSAWQGMDLSQTFALHSNPSATKTIYLDFDGHTTSNTIWNMTFERQWIVTPTFSLDRSGDFSDYERAYIQRVF